MIKWIVPVYARAATVAVTEAAAAAPKPALPVGGLTYLAVTAALVFFVTTFSRVTGRQGLAA